MSRHGNIPRPADGSEVGPPDGPDQNHAIQSPATDRARSVSHRPPIIRPRSRLPRQAPTIAQARTYPDRVAPGPNRSAAFFDLDKTIIARSSTFAFSRPFYAGGLITRRAVLRSAYAHFVYLAGGADHDQMERMRQYLSDWSPGGTCSRCATSSPRHSHELIQPVVYRGGDGADRRAPCRRPGRRDRVLQRRRGGRADRGDARRRSRRRDPDGRRGRPLHRRDRVLRLRREQGPGVRELAAERGYDLGASATPTAIR